MNAATGTPKADRRRRRRLMSAAVVIVAIAVVAGLAAAWLFFFGSEAPDAPTLDNAIKVLLPSGPPQ